RPPRGNGEAIRPHRLTIAVVDDDLDVRVGVVRVEDARRLVAREFRLLAVTPRRYVTLRDRPSSPADHRARHRASRIPADACPDGDEDRGRLRALLPRRVRLRPRRARVRLRGRAVDRRAAVEAGP